MIYPRWKGVPPHMYLAKVFYLKDIGLDLDAKVLIIKGYRFVKS